MRIIARKTLERYVQSRTGRADQSALRTALEAWYHEVRDATWSTPAELKAQFASASVVGDRVVFNIKGNNYRLVAAIDFKRQIAFVKWIGTHAEYDRIDVRSVRYGD